MKTTIEKSEGKVLVILEGHLDSYQSGEVATHFEELYDLSDTEITLDCSKLDYIASNGLRLFFMLIKNTGPHGCEVLIKGANKELMDIFDSTGFTSFFRFV
jgi:anti-sigma B factor antagonist